MSIKLTTEDSQFILAQVEMPKNLRAKLKRNEILSDEEADNLRDLCGEKLQVSGFDYNYRANEIGKRFENIMDKLFTG